MAYKMCRSCRRGIKAEAESCPHCGHSNKVTPIKINYPLVLIVVFSMAILYSIVSVFKDSNLVAPLLISVAVIFLAYKIMHVSGGKISNDGTMICPNCGTRGEPKTITQGSLAIEIILWLCIIVPGLIYSIWRLTTRLQTCPSCGQTGMINVNTPNGRLLVEKLQP